MPRVHRRPIAFHLQAAALFLLLGTIGCRRVGMAPGEGFIETAGGKVWYRIVGTGRGTPLLVIHGCCGAASYYLKPLSAHGNERPVVFYDQLWAGHSDFPSDTSVWGTDQGVAVIAQIRKALGLKEIHFYGHSSGAGLAVEYALAHPSGILSVTLAGGGFSTDRFLRDMDSLRGTLPDSLRSALIRHERAGTCDAPEYRVALLEFFQRHHARRQPWSADVDSSFRSNAEARSKYRAMGGASCAGPDYPKLPAEAVDHLERLGRLGLPVLFITGEFDYATPSAARIYQRSVPGSDLVVVEHAGHLMMQDEPQRDLQALRDFLRRVERR